MIRPASPESDQTKGRGSPYMTASGIRQTNLMLMHMPRDSPKKEEGRSIIGHPRTLDGGCSCTPKVKSSQVKSLPSTQIKNSPPLAPGAGSSRRRQNCALMFSPADSWLWFGKSAPQGKSAAGELKLAPTERSQCKRQICAWPCAKHRGASVLSF